VEKKDVTVTKELTAPEVVAVDAPSPGIFQRITRGRQIGPRKTLEYGTSGIGKSTWASMAPSPIFLPTEDGLKDIDCSAFPVLGSLSEFMTALGSLCKQPHDYKTVVIDSLDWLERLIWTKVCADSGVDSIGRIKWGEGYNRAADHWRNILAPLDYLCTNRGMAPILIAHAHIVPFANPETDGYDRYVPKLHKHATSLIVEWCDEVFFASYQVFTRKAEERAGERNIGVSKGERVLRTTERPFCIAKNRLNLPDELPLDWREYAKFLPGAQA
jgi:hypothetical protein